jgi:hypothetical protein
MFLLTDTLSPTGVWVLLCNPLTPVWRYSLLQVLLPSQFQKGLEANSPSQCTTAQAWSFWLSQSLSTVTHIFINLRAGLGWHWGNYIPWQKKKKEHLPPLIFVLNYFPKCHGITHLVTHLGHWIMDPWTVPSRRGAERVLMF